MFQARHQLGAGKKGRGRSGRERSVPVKEAATRLVRKKLREQVRGSGVELGVELRGELGMRGGLGREFRETERDRTFYLLREVEVMASGLGEQRVDKVQSTQVVAGGDGSRHF